MFFIEIWIIRQCNSTVFVRLGHINIIIPLSTNMITERFSLAFNTISLALVCYERLSLTFYHFISNARWWKNYLIASALPWGRKTAPQIPTFHSGILKSYQDNGWSFITGYWWTKYFLLVTLHFRVHRLVVSIFLSVFCSGNVTCL